MIGAGWGDWWIDDSGPPSPPMSAGATFYLIIAVVLGVIVYKKLNMSEAEKKKAREHEFRRRTERSRQYESRQMQKAPKIGRKSSSVRLTRDDDWGRTKVSWFDPDDEFRESELDAAFTAGRSTPHRPPQETNTQEVGLRVGDSVVHAIFGEGIVLDITGSGDKTAAVVNFRERGRKEMLLAWAPLKKV